MNSQEAITLLRNLEDALDSYCELNEEGKTAFRMAITALNCSEIPNNWIPCSERLPEDEDYDETFTVTIQCEHVDGWDDYVTGYADWTPHGWDIQSYYMGQIKIIAWMPLPEPYREVDE